MVVVDCTMYVSEWHLHFQVELYLSLFYCYELFKYMSALLKL